ncbi:etoposide-induced protein 2.4 [Biomphalaria glabrata]
MKTKMILSVLQIFIWDIIFGVKDSLSGWWVALKCWRDEARLISNRPSPPKRFSEIAKKRNEQLKKQEPEGTMKDIIWNTVTTAGVALLVSGIMLIQGCRI